MSDPSKRENEEGRKGKATRKRAREGEDDESPDLHAEVAPKRPAHGLTVVEFISRQVADPISCYP